MVKLIVCTLQSTIDIYSHVLDLILACFLMIMAGWYGLGLDKFYAHEYACYALKVALLFSIIRF